MFMIGEQSYPLEEHKIPTDVVANIIKVFFYGLSPEVDYPAYTLICDRAKQHWTTWQEVLDLRKQYVGKLIP